MTKTLPALALLMACEMPPSTTTGDLKQDDPTQTSPPPETELEPEPLPAKEEIACGEDHHAYVDIGVNPSTFPIPRVDAWQRGSDGSWYPLTLDRITDGKMDFLCEPGADVTVWIWP
jgi:hypothetical protein